MCINKSQLEQLYSTEFGAVYQCNSKNCYWLELDVEWHPLNVSHFLSYQKEIDSIGVVSILTTPSGTADVVILRSFRAKRCFVLSALQILQLKELLDATRFVIELNSLLKA